MKGLNSTLSFSHILIWKLSATLAAITIIPFYILPAMMSMPLPLGLGITPPLDICLDLGVDQ